jgi:hypothetical protein
MHHACDVMLIGAAALGVLAMRAQQQGDPGPSGWPPTHRDVATQLGGPRDSCTAFEFGRLLLLDTTGMQRSAYRGSIPGSTGGVNAVGYYRDGVLRILSARYLGEMGFSTLTFYFATPKRYVADFTESFYDKPRSLGGSERVVSTVKQVFYVCDGYLADSLFQRRRTTLGESLERLLTVIPPNQ